MNRYAFLKVGLLSAGLLGLLACQVSQTPPPPEPPTLRWYSTCGDPVCGAPNASPQPNTCGSRQEGQLCQTAGETCDLGNDCHQQLICATSDPKQQPGGCPISLPVYKQDIQLLGPLQRQQLAQKLQQLPLATWQYRFEPQGPMRLGFLIEAGTPPELVKPDGNSVDLYGYLSMAVAAIQEQESRLQHLEAQLRQLKADCPPAGSAFKQQAIIDPTLSGP